jgi:invasion protein IalB
MACWAVSGRRLATALTLVSMVLGGFAASAVAQEGKSSLENEGAAKTVTTRTTSYNGWTVVCTESGDEAKKICSANFRVLNQKTRQNILVWLFGYNSKDEPLSEFSTPTDVLIEPGVAVTLDDGEPLKAEFVSCGTTGCKAVLPLDDSTIAAMKEAKRVKINMTRLDGQVIQFAFDIPGIDLALGDVGF